MTTHRNAFTLIELLVVISIVALLVSILLPALASARETSRSIDCFSRLKSLGMVSLTYTSDFKEYLPYPNWAWRGRLAAYFSSPQKGMSSAFYCQEAPLMPANEIRTDNCAFTSSYPDSKIAWRLVEASYARKPLSTKAWLNDSKVSIANHYRAGDWNAGKDIRHLNNTTWNRSFWDGHVENFK
jgi:prepilin-type N-terminal cleavage/methylation domain-containing protein